MQASSCRLPGIDSTRRSSLMNRSAWKRLWWKKSTDGMRASRLCGHRPCFRRPLYQRRATSGALPHRFRSRRVHRWFRRTGSGWIRISSRGPDCQQGLSRNAAGQRSLHCYDRRCDRFNSSENRTSPRDASSEEDEERTPAERSRFAGKLKKIDPAAFEATPGSSGRSPSTAGFSGGDHDRVRVGVARFRRPGLQDDQGLPLRPVRTAGMQQADGRAMLRGESGTVISTQGSPSPSLLSRCRTAPAGGQGVCAPCRARRRRTAPPVPVGASFA